MSIELVIPCNHLILCRPLLLLPSIFLSIKVFSNESVLRIRWPKHWSFSISPFSDYSGLISFRIGWFDLLADSINPSALSANRVSYKSIQFAGVGRLARSSGPQLTRPGCKPRAGQAGPASPYPLGHPTLFPTQRASPPLLQLRAC